MHRGEVDLGARHLFRRGNHFGRARNDHFAILVYAFGFEHYFTLCSLLLLCRDFDGDGVAHFHGAPEAQVLAEVNRAGSRKHSPKDRRDERSTPHAVADHLAKTAAHRIFRIDMRRIDVARHHGEEHYVLLSERALERGDIADFDFIEGAILDEFHLNTPTSIGE